MSICFKMSALLVDCIAVINLEYSRSASVLGSGTAIKVIVIGYIAMWFRLRISRINRVMKAIAISDKLVKRNHLVISS
ncbi:hypothetical protein VCR15J5_30246 [Vibrio crassostreae]|nr:hypothetical protein VCR15J5_30246 [Vibrio crassostreae]